MKQITKTTMIINGKEKTIVSEKNQRNLFHFEIQKKTRAHVFTDKSKVIPRKQKYKDKY